MSKKIPLSRQPPLYVSPRLRKEDLMVRDMALAGFPYKTIARHTGYTEGQVGYRIKLLGISPMDYRHGENELSRKVIAFIKEDSRKYFDTLVSQIKRYLKD